MPSASPLLHVGLERLSEVLDRVELLRVLEVHVPDEILLIIKEYLGVTLLLVARVEELRP